jgi:co-chaperonin GroES (HSP10)
MPHSVDNQYEPFVPLNDRLLLRRVEDAPTTKLGLPDKFRQQTNKFEVISVGNLVRSGIKPGDLVLAGEYNSERFLKDNEELWIVREADIRGVERLKCGNSATNGF